MLVQNSHISTKNSPISGKLDNFRQKVAQFFFAKISRISNYTIAFKIIYYYALVFNSGEPRPLYLDAQSTTPLDPRVLDAMLPYMTSYYGNPHSRTHAYGWESESAMEKGRAQIADLIGGDPKEIIFTSGATESNNIAVKGVAR